MLFLSVSTGNRPDGYFLLLYTIFSMEYITVGIAVVYIATVVVMIILSTLVFLYH